MSDISIVFSELFYGSGAWLGLLLFLALIITLSRVTKWSGVLMLPVCIFLAISYLDYPALMWNAVIMFFAAIFIIYNMVKGGD